MSAKATIFPETLQERGDGVQLGVDPVLEHIIHIPDAILEFRTFSPGREVYYRILEH